VTCLPSHGERDPNLGAVSDEDSRCDDDPDFNPDDWQDQALYDDMLCGVAATSPSLSLRGIVPTVHLLLKAFALMSPSLILMGGLLLVPAHLPVVTPTLTWMIIAVAQVTSVSTVTTSLHRLGELTVVHNVCYSTTKNKQRRREERVM
jgi:hypothetical protein